MKSETEISTELKEGVLLVNKPQGCTSYSLIRTLTKLTGIKKIGHAGTLDPFATGVLIILIGRSYTKYSDKLMGLEKEYLARICLGTETDSYDCDGTVVARSKKIPSESEVMEVASRFQGDIEQMPPMFSAKKVKGTPLYVYARKGIEIERKICSVNVNLEVIEYNYPHILIKVRCSKGTYIRSIAHDIGLALTCGAHLDQLQRTRCGSFCLKNSVEGSSFQNEGFDITPHLFTLENDPFNALTSLNSL